MKYFLLSIALFMMATQSHAVSRVAIGSLTHFCDSIGGIMSNNEIDLCILPNKYVCKTDSTVATGIKCNLKRSKKTIKIPTKEASKKPVMTADQIRAKRLAEWHKAHPQKSLKKTTIKKAKVDFSTLPKYCGNLAVLHGKVNFHRQEKAYYIKSHYSNRANNFSLFKLNNFKKSKLLGKTIIFLGNRNATYPLGGSQKGAFQSIIRNIKLLQVVNGSIDLNNIKKICSKY